jgi:glyoxylase-like metal-dependent hydrolase (beta-lactamase superfamily II)
MVGATLALSLGPAVTVASVCDAVADHPRRLEDAFAGLAGDAWPAVAARHRETVGADGRWRLPVHVYVVRAHGRTLLVDAGVGPSGTVAAEWLGVTGVLPEALAALGTPTDAVDVVLFTHLHEDHVGWGADPRSGALTFPRARYIVADGEWDSQTRQGVRPHVRQGVQPAERLGRLECVATGDLAPGVELIALPGHTAGHCGLVVHGDGRDVLLVGDAFNHPVQVEHPAVASGADIDASRAEATRRAVLERAAGGDHLVGSAHLPGGWWRVGTKNGGVAWEAVSGPSGRGENGSNETGETR